MFQQPQYSTSPMDLVDKSSIAALHKAASDRAVAALRSRLAQTTPTHPAQPQPARGIGASTWPINPAGAAKDGLASALPEPTTAAVGTAWPALQAVSAGFHGYQQAISSTSTATGQAAETEQAKIDRILDALQMPTAPQHSTRGPADVVANQLSTQTMQTLVFLGATARIKGQSCTEFIDSVEDTVVGMMQAPGKAADSALLYHRLVQQPQYQAYMQQKLAAAKDRPTGHNTRVLPSLQPAQAVPGTGLGLVWGVAADTWGAGLLGQPTQPAAASQQQQQPGSASNLFGPVALDDIWGADPNPCTPIPALSPIGGLAQLHPADMDSLMAMFMDSPRNAAAAAAMAQAALPPAASATSMHQMLMPSGWAQAASCSPRGSHMRGAAGSSTPRSLLGSLNQDRMQAHGSSAGQLASSQDASELKATLLPTIQAVPRQEPVSGSKELQPAQHLRTLQHQSAYINEQLHSKQQQQQAQMQVQGMPGAYSASHDQAEQPHLMAGSSYGSYDVISGVAKRTVVRQSYASSNSSAITSTHLVHPAGSSPLQNEPASSALSSAEHATAGPVVGSATWLGGTVSKRPGETCAQQQWPSKVPTFDITSTAGSAPQAIDTAADATGADTSDSNAWEQPNVLVQRAIAAADQQHHQQQQHQQQQMVNGGELQRTYVSHRFAIVGPAAQEGEKAVDMAQLPAAFRKHRGPILFL